MLMLPNIAGAGFALGSSIILSSFTKPAEAGPAYPGCVAACAAMCAVGGVAATSASYGLATAPAFGAAVSCAELCATICVASCFSNNTMILVQSGYNFAYRHISKVKNGDLALTLSNNKYGFSQVLKNYKSEGQFDFMKITAQDISNTSSTKTLEVTPSHGLIFHNNGVQTLDAARNSHIGDIILDKDHNKLSIINISNIKMSEKYTLETDIGTILASNVFVSTLCNEEVDGGEKLLGSTLEDWQQRHDLQ